MGEGKGENEKMFYEGLIAKISQKRLNDVSHIPFTYSLRVFDLIIK